MQRGYIKLFRCIRDNELWNDKPFDRARAWVDLILIANHKPGRIRRRGILVEVRAGEVGYSLRELADSWGWSLGKVQRFIDELKNDTQIDTRIDTENVTVTTLIAITNYKLYQYSDTETGTESDTEVSTETGTETIRKQVQNKNGKKESNIFVTPSLLEIMDYCQERKNCVDPEKWFNFYQSKGWMVGKNKMKDWRAAVRTWEKNAVQPEVKVQRYF